MSTPFTRTTFVALAALTLALGARADQVPTPVTVYGTSADTLSVRTKTDREGILGSYALSDGRTLKLRMRGNLVVADLGDIIGTELRPDTATTLSSADKRVIMRFNRDAAEQPFVTVSLAVEGAAPQTLASLR